MPETGATSTLAIPEGTASNRSPAVYDRVVERRRAVALARHFRESEGLRVAQIAERLGRSPATVKAYFYDGSYRYALTVASARPSRRAISAIVRFSWSR